MREDPGARAMHEDPTFSLRRSARTAREDPPSLRSITDQVLCGPGGGRRRPAAGADVFASKERADCARGSAILEGVEPPQLDSLKDGSLCAQFVREDPAHSLCARIRHP